MMEHYASHPGIIGFQVDNETTSRDVNNYDFNVGFRSYLKNKFGTPQNLNRIWGLQYWGMDIDSWDELAPRDVSPTRATSLSGNVTTGKPWRISLNGSRR